MSAVTLVLQLLRPAETVVAAHDCYGGTQRLLRALAGRYHFNLVFADLTSESALADIAACKPKLVWIETPSNPLLRITDIAAVARAAHDCGSIVVVDNTFLSPVLQQPLALGADIVVHSTTKYLNGHSDVVGGCVVAGDAALGDELRWWGNALGVTGAPFDSYLTLRGLRTLHLRMKQHLENADAVVNATALAPGGGDAVLPWAGNACRSRRRASAAGRVRRDGELRHFRRLRGCAAVHRSAPPLHPRRIARRCGEASWRIRRR
jgi:cystathionine gamma-synthase